METANGVAIVIGATVGSFAAALLLGWAALVLLFHALPRPAANRS